VVIPVVIALLVGVGVVALQQGWLSGDTSTTANPSPAATTTHATGHTMSTTPETPSASATPTEDESSATPRSPSPSRAGQAGAEVAQVLEGCQDKVRAADRVLKAADVGIGHWAEHVQAQTDANSGKISVKKMDAIFKRTRLDGPDDVKAYDRARDDVDQSSGSCDEPEGATGPDRDKIEDCAARSKAQRPVLAAAEDGMDDWESHLAAMRRSRMGHVNDAQGVWIRAWRAAPPHIKAYEKAAKGFDAPPC
jgi:hypothetical protein